MSLSPILIDDVEWIRVKALIDLAEARRREVKSLPQNIVGILKKAEVDVKKSRNRGDWQAVTKKFHLQPADVEILILALASIASPAIGWLYRELQAGDTSGLPGIDLICELLHLPPAEVMTYRNRLASSAPLIKQGLIACERAMPFTPLRPTQRARALLLGLVPDGTEIPGATLVEPLPSLDDVICSNRLKEQLKKIASWPRLDAKLATWNIPLDHGPVSLFSGPSGTGKTLAATAVANEAGLTLYRVDLGLLVSKYIGETEKNLNAMFDRAAEMECALLFDEADSLFGKRGQVKDAKDRYANMEVGHLLSRIERHQGMCLLTSNLRENLDSAFFRRIDVVVHFNFPTEEERQKLWEKYMGKMLRYLRQNGKPSNLGVKSNAVQEMETGLLTKLSKGARLTGAQIANACRYTGRLLAANSVPSNNGQPPDTLLPMLAESVHNELKKNGNEVLRSSIGFLWDYLSEDQR